VQYVSHSSTALDRGAMVAESLAPDLQGMQVAVAGLGRSGMAAVRFLAHRGARVTASERKLPAELGEVVGELEQLGVMLECGGNRVETFASADLVVVSPGVPLSSPPLAAARAAGVPVWAEVELAFRFLRGTLLGITGSNGKSTVTAWTAHLLAQAGLNAVACGNLGVPLLSLVDDDEPGRLYVTELSSFQLEGIHELRPAVALMTNMSPDHQDRYDCFDDYVDAKARLFENQCSDDHAVLNAEDVRVARMAQRPGGPCRSFFSTSGPVERGTYLQDGMLKLRLPGEEHDLIDAREIALAGRHNLDNALAAALTARLAGAPADALAAGLRSFRGLPHRMEKVGEVSGVTWFNDSKATNLGATRAVVASLEQPLVLLLGGQDKGADFATLADLLPGRVRHLILMGEARGTIAAALSGVVPATQVETMADAVEAAHHCAQPGDAVLLAPACTSFDAYRSFEERGDDFRQLVQQLQGRQDG